MRPTVRARGDGSLPPRSPVNCSTPSHDDSPSVFHEHPGPRRYGFHRRHRAWLGFDRFGIDHFNPTADRIRTLSALVQQGYADRIHLSHDAACFYDFMVDNPFFADEHPDYLFISNEVIPRLEEAGVTPEVVAQMMEENPRRFFG